MKKIIGTILFFLLIFNSGYAAILEYEDSVKIDSDFSEFGLLEDYLKNHKNKLVGFQKKYEINDNQKLQYYIDEIEILETLARNIYKNKKVDYDRKEVSEEIVKKLKNINIQLKEILIYEKYKFEQNLKNKHTAYSTIGENIGTSIYKKIEEQVETIKTSDLSKENKLKIVIHLRNLEKNALKLKNFKNMVFENQTQMKEYFIDIFKEIKTDLKSINSLLK